MKTNKIFKYIVLSLLSVAIFTGCKDDDDLGTAPRLFRPVTTLDNQNNNLIVTWGNIKGATSYELELYKATGEKTESGAEIVTKYLTTTTNTSPYTFENVPWDEKYAVRIKAIGNNIESEFYDSKLISIVYPTKLTGSKTIDIAAMLSWSTGGSQYTKIVVNTVDNPSADPIEVRVSASDYEAGKKAINGLEPNTSYQAVVYSGEEGDSYEGRLTFKTREAEDFDAKYGAGMYLDIRGDENASILTSADFLSQINAVEGMTVILQGNFLYKLGSSIKFKKSVNFVTGLSLEGNAIFSQAAALQTDANATIEKITFTEVDFYSDKALDESTSVAKTTDKGFGGRQVYNINGTNSLLKELRFTNCRLEGYRALVRMQAATDGIAKTVFDGCTINGVGDQGAVTSTNLAGVMDVVEFNNCTITNVIMLADLRASKNKPEFTISNCTFCYAPLEATAAGANLFRFEKNAVNLNVENTVFGPSMALVSGNMTTYTASTKGSIMLNASATTCNVKNSFKTNFAWTVVGESATYPLEGLTTIAMDENALFNDPTNEIFSYLGNFDGSSTAGAIKWRK